MQEARSRYFRSGEWKNLPSSSLTRNNCKRAEEINWPFESQISIIKGVRESWNALNHWQPVRRLITDSRLETYF